jgi:hypothetical protein
VQLDHSNGQLDICSLVAGLCTVNRLLQQRELKLRIPETRLRTLKTPGDTHRCPAGSVGLHPEELQEKQSTSHEQKLEKKAIRMTVEQTWSEGSGNGFFISGNAKP